MADLLFPLIDPQIRERKFQQREIDLDELTDEELLGNLLPDLTFFWLLYYSSALSGSHQKKKKKKMFFYTFCNYGNLKG